MNATQPPGWSTDGEGRLLTRPKHLPYNELPQAWVSRSGAGPLPDRVTDQKGRSWRAAQAHIRPTVGRVASAERPRDLPQEGKSYHDEVVLAAFVSLDETEAAVTDLASFLLCISTLVWVLAALCAALAPTQDIGATDPAGRIGTKSRRHQPWLDPGRSGHSG